MTAEAEVRRRIDEDGAISFAEFMEAALYWPHGGYYASGGRVGASGDYFTSPLVHPGFAALIAVQLHQMWQVMGSPGRFTIVEVGAGDGLLCRDILSYAEDLPARFSEAMSYLCIDRRVTAGHERDLKHAHRIVADALPVSGVEGCILSNELLDAFPVHQVVMEEGALREVYVVQEEGNLITCTGELSTPALAERLDDLGVTLADGQTAEINLGLEGWGDNAASALSRGFVLTVDYGRSARELYSARDRLRGTLSTFYRHVQTDSPLQRIGRQDITSQVDFTSVVRLGERAGLDFLDITDQRSFLGNLGVEDLLGRLRNVTAGRTEFTANYRGILELVDPSGLGDFKVLAQGKNVETPSLWGFRPAHESRSLTSSLPTPTLTARHLNFRPRPASG